jgi:hypothetical protein
MPKELPSLKTVSPTNPLLQILNNQTPNHLIWGAKELFHLRDSCDINDCIIDRLLVGRSNTTNTKTRDKVVFPMRAGKVVKKMSCCDLLLTKSP